jgi:puromycin-sensitive aminopeptidase
MSSEDQPMGEQQQNGVEEKGYQRLPAIAKPTHYKISLKPDLEKFTFQGEVTIDVELTHSTDHLLLNAAELEIKSAAVRIGRDVRDNLPFKTNPADETVRVELNHELTPGPIKLKIGYTGTLNNKMHGFYRSKYTDSAGKEKFMASTQFESTYARYAFPCWDEPIYKAKYDVSLTVPKDKTALSCMNEIKTEETEDGLKKVTYDTTPLMSSYLMAFAVGEFSYVEEKTSTGVTVRIYTLPGKQEQGRFALEVARKALEFYDKFFGIPYPLPKSDLIAIPDFAMGAMENWGLVTYRDVYLLADPNQSSVRAKTNIALVVGHELAHMWFGNLVTMKWWTDLWLKEGFATFMEFLFVSENYPEFNIWLHFANEEIARGMGLDALKSSHPIEVPIENPNELEEIYDAVSYSKSASVIRMLFYHLGQETFQEGLKQYLSTFQFGNAVTQDLWTALSTSSGQQVDKLMSSWTSRMGFPLVTVSSRQDGADRVLTLSQKRFIADGSPESEGTVWQIPVDVSTAGSKGNVAHKFLLKEKEEEVRLPGVGAEEWVKLNAGLTGYYRVEYSKDMLEQLLPAVRDRALDVLDRFNLVTDLYALVKAGELGAAQFLDLVDACSEEENYNVWAEMDVGIASLGNVLARDAALKDRFDAFVRKAYGKIVAKTGWDPKEGESSQVVLLRSLVLARVGMAGEEGVKSTALHKFRDLVENGKDLSPDQRAMIFALVGRWTGEEGFESLKKLFESSDFSEVQRHCLAAMANSPDCATQKKCLQYSTTGGKVRSGDLYLSFSSATSTAAGQDTAWAFFKEHYQTIVEMYGGPNSAIFQAIVKISTRGQASEDHAKEVEEFFKEKIVKTPVLDRPVKQSVENVRLNAALLRRNGQAVADWLTQKGF